MSVTHHDPSFDSGHNHLKPFIIAVAMFAAVVTVSVLLAGLPH